ncbi:ATP phosphoribosyltransferase regulatory subunit [Rhodobacterales bacterium HKCCE3408]|nr:ATP phosphoribosyltransferase regulatory subunit [Rhodobacterales bacterium HKCCE3408]
MEGAARAGRGASVRSRRPGPRDPGPPFVTDRTAIRAEAEAIAAAFRAAGAVPVEADLLQPAGTLLDLYGEDIRARAYITQDPDWGEMMLRPDFTVPVVQMHMESGAAPARYTYLGEVFRVPPAGSGRPREYLQAGFELFDGDRSAEADAEVFALFSRILAPLKLEPVTGDMGILIAAVDGLATTERRKRALRRHLWRPRRFRALFDRFAGRTEPPAPRRAMLAAMAEKGADAMLDKAGPEIGQRSAADVRTRLMALAEDAGSPPIPPAQAEVLDAVLSLRETLPNALTALRDICVDMPGIAPAVDGLGRRMAALEAAGIDPATLPFEASYGRTNMEYYDGFVFGFVAPGRPDLPPVATGGRYDALTRILGRGTSVPAVGGVIRPEIVARLKEGAA